MRYALILLGLLTAGGCSFDDTLSKPITAWDLGDDAGGQSDVSVGTDSGAGDVATEDTGPNTPDIGIPDVGDAGAAVCGNRVVEAGEDCDDGNMSEDDDCLNDCTFACGDGVVNAAEICDTGIAAGAVGACPADCDDGDACTTGSIQGTGCQMECVYGQIAACVNDDGCCAAGCNETTDNDCAAMCGNSVVETGEVCDPPASCASSCDDGDACTQNVLSGSAATCDAVCTYPPITACVADGCCAPGCNSTNDPDCSASCGNGVVEAGETCDPVASCPTSCDDGDACTNNVLTGSAANCNAACTYPAKTTCQADGCCVPGCNAVNDPDCSAVCGNMVVEPGEQCDDGNMNPNDACDACVLTGNVTPTAFLLTDLDVRDPHMFAYINFLGCQDITNQVLGFDGVNPQFQKAIQTDSDNDGLLDLSLLAVFRPLIQSATGTGTVDFIEGNCSAPIGSTSCQPAGTAVSFTYTNQASGTCLDVVPGTTRATYTPAIAKPSGPCFSTDAQTIALDLNGIIVTLADARFGASYVGVPATSLSNGLIRGFLTQATAEAIILPSNLPLVGGSSMASVLRGHSTNCASGSDMDTHPSLGSGWWLYLNFPASKATFIEP